MTCGRLLGDDIAGLALHEVAFVQATAGLCALEDGELGVPALA